MMRRFLAIVALCLLGATPLPAHRGHDALTVVTIDANGGISVSHRFETHDIEPALAMIAPDAQASLDDPDAVAALVAYAGRAFRLASERGDILLVPGQPEIGASEVRLPFTAKPQGRFRKLTVSSSLLADVHRAQLHQVNVKSPAGVRTLTFRGGGSQTLVL